MLTWESRSVLVPFFKKAKLNFFELQDCGNVPSKQVEKLWKVWRTDPLVLETSLPIETELGNQTRGTLRIARL
jgi:hypothetical protein